MKLTARGRLVAAVGTGALLAGALTLSLPMATLGLALVLYLAFTRLGLARDLSGTRLRVRRDAPPSLRVGETGEIRLDASEARLPEGHTVLLTDVLPDGLRAEGPRQLAGGSVHAYAVTGIARGVARFTAVDGAVVDRRGIWESRLRLPVATSVDILPSLAPIAAGRKLARRPPALELRHAHPAAIIMQELDHETIREFQSGDRLRDVDWKRLSVFQELFTKTRERERPDSVMLVLDASRTMRARVGEGPARLEHAAEVAIQLAHVAGASGHRVGYLVLDEGRVVAHARAARRSDVAQDLVRHLARLPRPLRLARRPDVAGLAPHGPDPAEAAFLARATGGKAPSAAAPLAGRAASLLRSDAGARVVAVLFTDLETDAQGILKLAGRLIGEGDRVAVVLLPGSRYLAPPVDPSLRDLENAYRETLERDVGARRLRALGARVVELGPMSDADAVRRQLAVGSVGGRRA